MPTEITAMLAAPNPAPTEVAAGTWVDGAWAQLVANNWLVVAGLLISLLVIAWIGRRVRRISRSDKPDEHLSNIAMVIGFAWSSEAIWELTGPGRADLPIGIRVGIFAVLEVILGISMIRTKRNMREQNITGRSGRTVWIVAGSMAVVAAVSAGGFAEAILRLLIPLLLINQWWDGVVGEGRKRAAGPSSWRWTPRRLLLWLGALEPGERDVETVHRDRLTQQMTRLYYQSLYGPEKTRPKRQTRLAKLTLDADDEIIREVMRRVTRTSWTTAEPLPYRLDQPGDASADEPDEDASSASPRQITATLPATVGKAVQIPSRRRVKTASPPSTSTDASGDDPATKAAHLVIKDGLSNQKAADAVGGTSEPSVRRRVKTLREAGVTAESLASGDASPKVPMTPIPEPRTSVTAGVNGNHPTLTEEY